MNADVVVVGLGAAGAATLFQLARRGVDAVGIDRYSPPHAHGSTHGDTRITREAIGEGEQYTPLVLRSHVIWREIEAETGADLLTACGALIIESPGAGGGMHHRRDFLASTVACARRYGIEHELLTASRIADRFPQFSLTGDESAYHEPGAGFVRPERCVGAQLELAERAGARVLRDRRVLSLERDGSSVRVRTDLGDHLAKQVVLAAGPWLPTLLPPELASLFSVYRQVLVWFALRAGAVDHSPAAMPVFIWGLGDGRSFFGIPAVDGPTGGVKVGTEQFELATTADSARADVGAGEPASLHARLVGERMPGLASKCLRAVRCLYTMTADANFVVDRHPAIDGVLIVSPCSGHGFKHSAGLGEAIAELVTTGESAVDLAPFSLDRAALSRASGS